MIKKDWLKKLKKISTSSGVDALKMEITPYRDWMILVSIFFIGLIGSFGFNIYMSVKINADNFFTMAPKVDEGVVLDKNGLEKILAGFAEKEMLFEKTKVEGVGMVDPSL